MHCIPVHIKIRSCTMRGRQDDSKFYPSFVEEDSLPGQGPPPGAPIDINNYPVLESYDLGSAPCAMQAVSNQLAQDIVMFTFPKRIAIYYLKFKAPEVLEDPSLKERQPLFDYQKLHELMVDDTDIIQSTSLSSDLSLSFQEKRLSYAFSLHDSNFLYMVDLRGDLPERINKTHWFQEMNPKFNNDAPITHIKFDLDQSQFVAVLTEEPACNVWNTAKRMKITSFPLLEKGVGISWHKSEPYKLMVAQRNGIIIFYNIVKQHAVQSVSVGKSPLLYVDWAPSNNYFVGCVSYSQAYIVDIAKPYSTHIKSFDTHPNFTNKLKFSPLDYKMFATMGRSDSRIKVFQLNFQSMLWSNRKPDMRDIEWLRARPFVLALAGSQVYVFKSSLLH
ncbi:unnamed protein product [Allacma fusca]|uniref:Uncharacterized protein n=1 Tax=Allacma fusca TaxID=39272 RepID=A0A8J2PP04_9HEXA|nr:unnamed protein product [Allacma fusca]